MLQPVPPAVYRCIIPIRKSFATPSTIYYSPSGNSGEAPPVPFYRAWPEIDDPERPCCLPTLMRAIYSFELDIVPEPEKAVARAEEYLSRPEVIKPEIHQQALAIIQALCSLGRDSARIDDLSPAGKYGRKRQRAFDTHNASIDFSRTLAGGQTNQLMMAAIQGFIGGVFTFPGVEDEDFTGVFAFLHEMAHWIAKFTHSGVIQEKLSQRIHTTLYTLATNKRLSQKRVTQLWEEYEQANEQIVSLNRKFEPIEEIFANFMALVLLPPDFSVVLFRSDCMLVSEKNRMKVHKTQ